ncbi:surface-adhesin E family protein [Luteimonas huabeiensis]|uniref:surface-adhesin E family protein n=1 Tax=Luteimonas huabeiensis TaxID=1244513 RepID=UPI00046552E8|nr:surface-adhesin E family protein [Luteimonas huabeiensis]
MPRPYRPLLLALALLPAWPCGSAGAQDGRWLYVTSTPEDTVVEIDRHAITAVGERVQVRVRYLFGPGGRRILGRTAHQAVMLSAIDCTAGTAAVLESSYHDERGRTVSRQRYLAPPSDPIREGSTMEAVAEQVCDAG